MLLFTNVSAAIAGIDPTAAGSQYPVIPAGGDGDAVYDAEGNKIFKITELENLCSGTTEDGLTESHCQCYASLCYGGHTDKSPG